jgi:hypothetical protein
VIELCNAPLNYDWLANVENMKIALLDWNNIQMGICWLLPGIDATSYCQETIVLHLNNDVAVTWWLQWLLRLVIYITISLREEPCSVWPALMVAQNRGNSLLRLPFQHLLNQKQQRQNERPVNQNPIQSKKPLLSTNLKKMQKLTWTFFALAYGPSPIGT